MRSRLAAADRLIGPIALFVFLYLATFLIVGRAAFRTGWLYPQIVALLSVSSATWVTLFFFDRERVRIGFAVRPLPDFATGALFGAALIAFAELLLFSHVRHGWGNGFPWLELGTVFAPAALHEELLFRGYVYQKLRAQNRGLAIVLTSLVFAALHERNDAITALALGNLVLAGVLLALAYEAHRTLWLPIGLHLAWNVTSGPILGYPVSGYVAQETVLATLVSGPGWLTGGAFGIEGSVAVTAAECGGIALLLWWTRMRAAKTGVLA
jgi:membrane protease YdiL (CAAX protease family)